MERPTSACRDSRVTLLAGEGRKSRAAYKEVGHDGVYSHRRVRSACRIGDGGGPAAWRSDAGAPAVSAGSTNHRAFSRAARGGRRSVLLRSGAVWFRFTTVPAHEGHRLRRDRAGLDSAARGESGQDGSTRRRAARRVVSRGRLDGDSHSDRARRSRPRFTALPRRHLHRPAPGQASALEILAAAWAPLPGRPGLVETLLRVARDPALAARRTRADVRVLSTGH